MFIGKRWKIAIIVLLAAGALAAARPASRWWSRRRTAALTAQCRAARDDRRWEDLQRIATAWAADDAASADARLFLAEVAEARHDWSTEVEHLARISETDPRVLPALMEQAKLEFGPLNRPLAGEAACLKMLSLEPRATFAHQRLVQYYAISLQREKLVRHIRFAVEQQREAPEAYVYYLLLNTLRMRDGVETNQQWLASDPEVEVFAVARAMQVPEPTDEKAGMSFDARDALRQASAGKLKLVESLLEKYPSNLELLSYKFDQYIMLGDVDRAAELLSRVPESAEFDSRFWRYKGWLHETAEELVEAESAYKKSLEIHPLDWDSWNRLAVIYRRLKNVEEVGRATGLVEKAQSLRKRIKTLPSAGEVTPEILADLARYARDCGAGWMADALDRRIRQKNSTE